MWSAAADIGRVVYSRHHAKANLNCLRVSARAEEASRNPPVNHQYRLIQNEQESSASDFETSGAAGNGAYEIASDHGQDDASERL
jgi:hypothetical protein